MITRQPFRFTEMKKIYFGVTVLILCNILLCCYFSRRQFVCERPSILRKLEAFDPEPFRAMENKVESSNHCLQSYKIALSMNDLFDVIQLWKFSADEVCRNLYYNFKRIFNIDQEVGSMKIPETFQLKLMKTYKFDRALIQLMKNQSILKVYNKITHDSNMYNPIRDKRPIPDKAEGEKAYVEKLTKETETLCDFCKYKKFTAFDVFGRIESQHSFTAANAFKYDGWHSMVIFRNHHPLNWNRDQYLDVFNTALSWIYKVHGLDFEYKYPMIAWDLMPHASASQVHPHIHMSVTKDQYYGDLEHWRQESKDYQIANKGRNYFTDLLQIHQSLKLAVHHGTASAFASITPKRDYEMVVLASKPTHDFFHLLFHVIRTYIDRMDKFCFSMVMVLPPLISENKFDDNFPAFARIVPRGSVAEVHSDVSSLVLFAGPDVHVNPYKAIKLLKESLRKK